MKQSKSVKGGVYQTRQLSCSNWLFSEGFISLKPTRQNTPVKNQTPPATIAKLVVFSGKTMASGSVIAPLTKHNVEIVKMAGRSIVNG
ncbi:hypothetical protein [Pseudoalteromonas sp. A757]|uniref:hypothetical protein n=1 Tax=Pseudoalteromonas sp. A757 TaxID=2250709 RepID=UPI001F011982|nr:hypothetical protein [Pseudoalteromonas sp. A757]